MPSEDIQHLAARFRQDGYLVIADFVAPDRAAALAAELDARVAEGITLNRPGPERSAYERERGTRVDVCIACDLPLAMGVLHDPRLIALSTAICGPRWRWAGEPAIFSTPAPGGRQGWHQDTSDPDPGQFFCNRICFPRSVTPEQGPLFVVPGSHRAGDIPPGEDHAPLPGEIAILPPAGSVVLLHSRCFHRVGENRSDRPRTQVNLRIRPEGARPELGRQPLFRSGAWDFAKGAAGDAAPRDGAAARG